jgi:hypothetical protein
MLPPPSTALTKAPTAIGRPNQELTATPKRETWDNVSAKSENRRITSTIPTIGEIHPRRRAVPKMGQTD